MFPVLSHRLSTGLRRHLQRAVAFNTSTPHQSRDTDGDRAKPGKQVNGSGGAATGNTESIRIPEIGSIVEKVEAKPLHQPPLEALEIYDRVSNVTRETVMYWRKKNRKPSAPEAAEKLAESLERLHHLVREKQSKLDHVAVAAMIHQLAAISAASKLSHKIVNHGLLKELLSMADECRADFDVNHIANIFWALGKIGKSTLFLSLGNGDRTVIDLVRSLIVESNELIRSFTPLTVCQVLYGLSMLSTELPEETPFVRLLAAVAKQQLSGFSAQGISVLFISLARLNYEDLLYLVPAMCKRVENQIYHFNKPQQLCNIAWGLAKMRYANALSLLGILAKHSRDKLDEFAFTEVSMLLWAFYKLKFHPGHEFLEQIEQYLRRHCHNGKPQEISIALVALADFGSYLPEGKISRDLINSLKSALRDPAPDMPEAETKHLTTSVWSLAVLGELDIDMMKWVLNEIVSTGRHVNSKQQRQLYQSTIALMYGSPRIDVESLIPDPQVQFLNLCKTAWLLKQKTGAVVPSMVDVFNVLRRIGYKCESRLVDNIISASTAENPKGAQIAVEIDTPIRCFHNQRWRRLGRYNFRHRVLEACGLKVLRFSLDEWAALEGMGARLSYLKAGLVQAEGR